MIKGKFRTSRARIKAKKIRDSVKSLENTNYTSCLIILCIFLAPGKVDTHFTLAPPKPLPVITHPYWII